jgi:hypothetical protein
MEPTIFIVAGATVTLLIIWLVIWTERRRREAVEVVAGTLGLHYSRKDPDGLPGSLTDFHLFSQGHRKRAENILTGSAHGIELSIFDYRYTKGAGKNSHTRQQTVIMLESGSMQLPRFVLRPANLFHRIGKTFGHSDIDFDNQPEFSGAYLLRGDGEREIRRLFTGSPISYFKKHLKLCVEGSGRQLIFYRSGKRVDPDNIKEFLEQGIKVFGLFVKK